MHLQCEPRNKHSVHSCDFLVSGTSQLMVSGPSSPIASTTYPIIISNPPVPVSAFYYPTANGRWTVEVMLSTAASTSAICDSAVEFRDETFTVFTTASWKGTDGGCRLNAGSYKMFITIGMDAMMASRFTSASGGCCAHVWSRVRPCVDP